METGRNRDLRRRNLTAADIVRDDDPIVITARQRLQAFTNQHPRPPDNN